MSTVALMGRLICTNDEDAATVRRHLRRHIELTRAESGCLHFDVVQAEDPLIWTVAERFGDQTAFDAHQARARRSDWGLATAGVKRDYVITIGGQ